MTGNLSFGVKDCISYRGRGLRWDANEKKVVGSTPNGIAVVRFVTCQRQKFKVSTMLGLILNVRPHQRCEEEILIFADVTYLS